MSVYPFTISNILKNKGCKIRDIGSIGIIMYSTDYTPIQYFKSHISAIKYVEDNMDYTATDLRNFLGL